MNYDLLKQNFSKTLQLSNTELEAICSNFKSLYIKKGDFLLEQGSICKFEAFVLEGCFNIYTIDKKGKENSLYFAVEDWWLMDIDSFMNQTPSDLNIQALEDSTILLIDKTSKNVLYDEFPRIEKLFRMMSQKAVAAWQRRVIRSKCFTAKERYLYFMETYPEIAIKLTDRQISSYLGITHEFLCKIKKQTC